MDYVKVYQQAWGLWKEKRFVEAEEYLYSFWRQSEIRTLRGMLLLAYIFRDEQRYVSEIRQLEELLRVFGHSEEKDLLADAWSMLGGALRQLGENELSVRAFLQAMELESKPEQKLVECSNAIFVSNAIDGITAPRMDALYAVYQGLLNGLHVRPYNKPCWNHACIRVGYLSGDLHNHPVAQFVRPLLLDYDPRQFRVYVYQLDCMCDEITQQLKRGGAVWKMVNALSFAELAAQIRSDEIDVLFDLSGHTAGNVLPVFAWKPALVQISGIGYFNSTGIFETRGFLSDRYCSPESESPYFIEPLLRLSHSHFCYQPFNKFPEEGEVPCLRKGYVTFGCFNNFAKVNDSMLLLWKKILEAVPGAHLLLKHMLFGTAEGREYTIQRFCRLGLPLERIELRGFSNEYLEQYHDIDIALDTSPYPGGLTSCEALYMGVPMVTMTGDRHGARFGYSFLVNLGLTELAADSAEKYVSIAVELSQDWELLQLFRQKLRGMMQSSSLMNGNQYIREMESLYRQLVDEKESV